MNIEALKWTLRHFGLIKWSYNGLIIGQRIKKMWKIIVKINKWPWINSLPFKNRNLGNEDCLIMVNRLGIIVYRLKTKRLFELMVNQLW